MCISGFKSRPGPHPEFCWESFLIWSFFLADTTVAIFEFLKPQIQKKRILRSQTLNIFTIYFTVTEHTSFTKNFLEWIKTIRNGSKFTIGKYYINTMEMEIVISCKNVYACITFFLIYNFFIFEKQAIADLWSMQGVILRNHWQFAIFRWGEKKPEWLM